MFIKNHYFYLITKNIHLKVYCACVSRRGDVLYRGWEVVRSWTVWNISMHFTQVTYYNGKNSMSFCVHVHYCEVTQLLLNYFNPPIIPSCHVSFIVHEFNHLWLFSTLSPQSGYHRLNPVKLALPKGPLPS